MGLGPYGAENKRGLRGAVAPVGPRKSPERMHPHRAQPGRMDKARIDPTKYQGLVAGRKAEKTGMMESEARAAQGETPMTLSAPAAPRVMAVLVGIAVPFLVFGRAVTAVLLIVAVVCVFFLPQRDGCLRSLVRQARTPVGIMVGVTLVLCLPGVVFSLDPLRSVLV